MANPISRRLARQNCSYREPFAGRQARIRSSKSLRSCSFSHFRGRGYTEVVFVPEVGRQRDANHCCNEGCWHAWPSLDWSSATDGARLARVVSRGTESSRRSPVHLSFWLSSCSLPEALSFLRSRARDVSYSLDVAVRLWGSDLPLAGVTLLTASSSSSEVSTHSSFRLFGTIVDASSSESNTIDMAVFPSSMIEAVCVGVQTVCSERLCRHKRSARSTPSAQFAPCGDLATRFTAGTY
jgi:hypothetical protein